MKKLCGWYKEALAWRKKFSLFRYDSKLDRIVTTGEDGETLG